MDNRITNVMNVKIVINSYKKSNYKKQLRNGIVNY